VFPLLALIAVGSTTQVALAGDGIEPIGISTESRTRGGTDVAIGDSSLSQIENPATLTLMPRDRYRFDATGRLLFPHNHWSMPAGSSTSGIDTLVSASFGLSLPIDDRLTLGIAVYSKSGASAQHNLRHLLIPWYERRVYGDLKNGGIALDLGYKLTDKLSVGVGIRGEAATAKLSTVLGPVYAETTRGYAWGGGFQLGLHYQATDDLAFGLGYRSPTWFGDMAGGDASASLYGLRPIDLGDGNVDEYRLPQKASVGVAWDATDFLKLSAEFRWINYDNCSLHRMTFATSGPRGLRIPFAIGYKDQYAVALGADIKLDERWTLGVGYHYATDPVSESHLLPVGTLVGHHHITVGPRYKRDNWWIGGGYIIALPSTVHGSDRSRIPFGIDYGDSSVCQTQHSIFVGFGFSW
jgi:long-chain fatty acid transport protein